MHPADRAIWPRSSRGFVPYGQHSRTSTICQHCARAADGKWAFPAPCRWQYPDTLRIYWRTGRCRIESPLFTSRDSDHLQTSWSEICQMRQSWLRPMAPGSPTLSTFRKAQFAIRRHTIKSVAKPRSMARRTGKFYGLSRPRWLSRPLMAISINPCRRLAFLASDVDDRSLHQGMPTIHELSLSK